MTRSYVELTTHLYSTHNLAKIEWVIGSALADGPNKVLVIAGPPASGKSTMLKIVETIFARGFVDNNVLVMHDGFDSRFDPKIHRGFVATNRPVVAKKTDMVVTTPTGNRHSHLTYVRLMDEVKTEIDQIANACLDRYLQVGPRYYEDLSTNNCFNQENNQ